VIVIGGSAGNLDTLRAIAEVLPAEFPGTPKPPTPSPTLPIPYTPLAGLVAAIYALARTAAPVADARSEHSRDRKARRVFSITPSAGMTDPGVRSHIFPSVIVHPERSCLLSSFSIAMGC
jgi:hypothetical protein